MVEDSSRNPWSKRFQWLFLWEKQEVCRPWRIPILIPLQLGHHRLMEYPAPQGSLSLMPDKPKSNSKHQELREFPCLLEKAPQLCVHPAKISIFHEKRGNAHL